MPDGILPGISLVFSVANLYDVLSPENSSHIRTSYSSGDRTNALFCSDKTFTNSDEAHCSTTKLPISQLSRIIIRGSTEHSFMAGDLPVCHLKWKNSIRVQMMLYLISKVQKITSTRAHGHSLLLNEIVDMFWEKLFIIKGDRHDTSM